jgi:hypothetical protein
VLRAPLSDDEVLAEIWASHGEGAVEADALGVRLFSLP